MNKTLIITAILQIFIYCGKEFGLDRKLEAQYIKCIEPEAKLFEDLILEFSKEGYWFPYLKASYLEGSLIITAYKQITSNSSSLSLSYPVYHI